MEHFQTKIVNLYIDFRNSEKIELVNREILVKNLGERDLNNERKYTMNISPSPESVTNLLEKFIGKGY